jgi:hypothetical protein
MKRPDQSRTLLLLLALLAATAVLTACGGPRAQIREIDGITHVINPAEPLRPNLVVTLEEQFRIGQAEAEDEFMLPGVQGLASDAAGRIYVLGPGEDRVRVYNADGTWSHWIGRHGQGPGELHLAAGLSLGGDGNLWVSNVGRMRMSLYTPAGEHVRDIPFPGAPPLLTQTTPSGFMGLHVNQRLSDDQKMISMTFALRKFSDSGDSLGTLFSTDLEMELMDLRLGGLADKMPFYTQDDEGRVWQTRARTDAYEINVYGPDGTLERVVEKNFQPIPKTAEEIQYEKELVNNLLAQQTGGRMPEGIGMSYEPNPNRTATGLPYWDPRGLIWQQAGRHDDINANAFDLFDRQGRFLQRIIVEGVNNPAFLTFHGDRLVLSDNDPEVVPQVIVFKVTMPTNF